MSRMTRPNIRRQKNLMTMPNLSGNSGSRYSCNTQKLQTIDEGILLKDKNKLLYKRLPRPMQYLITVAVLLLCITATAPAQTAEQIAEKALAATVYLEMKDSTGKTLGFGSGFFVRENLVATNYHVIEGAARGTAKLVGKYTTYTIEGITATDKINDLTLLKVTAYGIKPLPSA